MDEKAPRPTAENGTADHCAPFTTSSIRVIVTSVIKQGTNLPTEVALSALADELNRLRWLIEFKRGAWEQGKQRRIDVKNALLVLEENLPLLMPSAETYLADHAPATFPGALASILLGPSLKVVNDLRAAVEAMKARPFLLAEGRFGPDTEDWKDVAPDIAQSFIKAMQSTNPHTHFGLKTEGPATRFVSEVLPAITGEGPKPSAVRSHFKKSQ